MSLSKVENFSKFWHLGGCWKRGARGATAARAAAPALLSARLHAFPPFSELYACWLRPPSLLPARPALRAACASPLLWTLYVLAATPLSARAAPLPARAGLLSARVPPFSGSARLLCGLYACWLQPPSLRVLPRSLRALPLLSARVPPLPFSGSLLCGLY